MQKVQLIDCLCPILGATRKGNAKFIGSSVLIQIHKSHFLVTAAHVIDANAYSTLYVPGAKYWIQLEAHSSKSVAPNGAREHDLNDVAYCFLSQSTVSELNTRFIFVPMGAVDLSSLCSEKRLYTFSGFPTQNVKLNRRVRSTFSRRFTFTTMGLDEASVYEIGLTPNSHVAVDFNWNESRDDKSNPVTPPKLNGMSGGAVWSWPRGSSGSTKVENPRLTAISIEHRSGQRVLFGTNIELALAAIRHDYPELDPFIPQSKRIRVRTTKIPSIQ